MWLVKEGNFFLFLLINKKRFLARSQGSLKNSQLTPSKPVKIFQSKPIKDWLISQIIFYMESKGRQIITFEAQVLLGLITCLHLDSQCKLNFHPQLLKITPVTVEGVC